MSANTTNTTTTNPKLIVYHTNWATYGRNFQVKDLPIDSIDEIAYAFAKLEESPERPGAWRIQSTDPYADFDKRFTTENDSVSPPDTWNENNPQPFFGNLGQFYKLKTIHKKPFQLSLSIGGWTLSKMMSDAMLTPISRESVIDSIINWFQRYPIFDGVNIDWEYLSNDGVNYGQEGNIARKEDASNFMEFLKLLRQRLPNYRISMCVSGAASKAKFPISSVAALVDELHIMTYDFASSAFGDTVSRHQTNLFRGDHCVNSVHDAVEFYLGHGVPANKLFIGAAFYSRGFADSEGLGKSCRSGAVVADKSWEDGVCDYKSLPRPGAIEYWDEGASAGYSYDKDRKILNSYDTVESMTAKSRYVRERGLGGIICWESSGDVIPSSHTRSLIGATSLGLRGL